MNDLRTKTKEELVDYVVENRSNSHTLAKRSEKEVREWAESKDRQFLIEIGAGWNKDMLIALGLRSA
jgi:hypothetical protein